MQLIRLPHRIVTNATVKLLSDLAGRLVSLFLFIWIARRLSAPALGWYLYGLSAGFLLAQLADMGLQLVLAREIAIHGRPARPLVRQALRLKGWLSLPVLLLLPLAAAAVPAAARPAVLLLGGAQLLQTFLEFAGHVFRGQERLGAESGYLFLARVLTALLALLVLAVDPRLLPLAAACVVAQLLALWRVYRQLAREGWLAAPPSGRRQLMSQQALLRTAVPLGVATFASIAYTRLAVLMLQPLAGETAVAHFGAALRLIEPLLLLPAALLAAVFPVFSRLWQEDRSRALQLGRLVSGLLLLAALLLAGLLIATLPWLLPLLFGAAMRPAVPVAQLLSLLLLPAFLNYSLTYYLIARNQQGYITLFTLGMLLLHGALCVGLIPRFGIYVPALTMLLAELFLMGGCLLVLRFRAVAAPADAPLVVELS